MRSICLGALAKSSLLHIIFELVYFHNAQIKEITKTGSFKTSQFGLTPSPG